jgi:hypothetical protein
MLPLAAFGQLLTGQTPNSFSTPPGWTVTSTADFESGACGGSFCNGNFSTTHFHSDGNGAHTHALECQYGTDDCGNGSPSWNKFLPSGTREMYLSWYEWLDTGFRMNDEFFLARIHWDTGNGQPKQKENILDYFQNSSLQYNSTDATFLMNIQGQPYYQNKLPNNWVGDTTNFTITTGSFVQHELYMRFSSVKASVSIPGTVTINGAARTYTRSTGSWITDGVTIGCSPHFTGFSNDANNGGGGSGGGASSYFVTALTDTVMTVSGYPQGGQPTNEGPISSVTMTIDRNDGAYKYWKNGTLVAAQLAMINPGEVDWKNSNTTVTIGESYSKIVWHSPILKTDPNCVGDCATDTGITIGGNAAGCERMPTPFGNGTGTFVGTCSSSISGGCGYEFLPFGWNGAGFTQPTSGGGFSKHIDCDTTWGGPMPTPPVFKRYLDDVILLTKADPQTRPVATATVATSSDANANYATITFPDYAKFKFGDGMISSGGLAGTSKQGLMSYWDLKNDPGASFEWRGNDTGFFEHQWGIKNANASLRYNELKEGPCTFSITEQNDVRVKITQSNCSVRSVGLLTNTADCCMKLAKSYVFYRNGDFSNASAKIFTSTTLTYDGTDGLGPLTSTGTGTGINYYSKIAWDAISGEVNNQTNQNGPCSGGSGLVPYTLSPLNVVYQGSGTNANKDYILLAMVDATSAAAGEFLPANTCTSGTGAQTGPESTTSGQPVPGQVWKCNSPVSGSCGSQQWSGHLGRVSFFQSEFESTGNHMSVGIATYFGGGLRFYSALPNQNFASNVPVNWKSFGVLGDSGITSTTTGDAYAAEYKTPPTATFATGSGGAFDPVEGYWTMAAAGGIVSVSFNSTVHSPALFVSSFSGTAPATMQIGGVSKSIDVDYKAVKTDGTHLLIQPLGTFPASTSFQVTSGGAAASGPGFLGVVKVSGATITQ